MKRHLSGIVAACVLAAVVAGCSKPAQVAAPAAGQADATASKGREPLPMLDMRSPDSLVKSYWALDDWFTRNPGAWLDGFSLSEDMQALCKSEQSLLAGDGLEFSKQQCDFISEIKAEADKLSTLTIVREIREVQTESETRAIVVAHFANKTPIPSSMTLSSDDRERRDFGRDVRYIVEKTPEGWRLTGAYSRDVDSVNSAQSVPASASKLEREGWTKNWETEAPPVSSELSSFDLSYAPEP
jgi:hypothetical protein